MFIFQIKYKISLVFILTCLMSFALQGQHMGTWGQGDSLFSRLFIQGGVFEKSASDPWTLQINEICASNTYIIADEFGEFEDWVEIYNYGSQELLLNGLYLSDNPLQPNKHQIPLEGALLRLPAGGHLLLWLDEQPTQGNNHVNFSLDFSGEFIGIYSDALLPIDEVSFGHQKSDHSFGRANDASAWIFFETPSPGEANLVSGKLGIISAPITSINSGYYQAGFKCALSHENPEAEIRYTLNGRCPNETDSLYSEAINIAGTSILQAKAFHPDYIESPVLHRSFIFESHGHLESISLAFDSTDVFGNDGIYSKPYSGLEKAVHLCYFDTLGNVQFDLGMGMRIHGPDSRKQKSLRFYTRPIYNSKEISHPLFSERPYTSYKRFILRNGGNDGLEINHTGIRDAFTTRLFGEMGKDYAYSAYKPVRLYLNGAYWGLYNMRERQDASFIESLYGYEENTVDFIEWAYVENPKRKAITGTLEDYDLMEQSAIDLDLSLDENYAFIADWMNIENYVDYQLLEIYIINQDWINNNVKAWKPIDDSRKWEWVIWDTEYGMGNYRNNPIGKVDFDALNMALTWGGWGNEIETELLSNLVENKKFADYFCSRGADLLNANLRSDHLSAKIDGLAQGISPELERQFSRWGGNRLTWQDDIDYMKTFVNDRPYFFREHFRKKFELGENYQIRLDVEPADAGYIEVNSIYTDVLPWQGSYYDSIPVRIKAVALPGYRFVSWEDPSLSAQELFIDLDSDSSFTALFEPVPLVTNPMINEIHYNPSLSSNSGEWIELYNPGEDALNLSEWSFNDGGNNPFIFPEGTSIGAKDFLIVLKDSLLFKSQHPETMPVSGPFVFKLSNEGETLYLRSPGGEIIDEVTYGISNPWPTSANGTGPSLELSSPLVDNAKGVNWFSNPHIAGGSPGRTNELSTQTENISYSNIEVRAFPNPFQNQTVLLIPLDHQEISDTQVIDQTGRIVCRNLASTLIAGQSAYIWNGQNSSGNLCSPGIYFFKAVARDRCYSERLVLIR